LLPIHSATPKSLSMSALPSTQQLRRGHRWNADGPILCRVGSGQTASGSRLRISEMTSGALMMAEKLESTMTCSSSGGTSDCEYPHLGVHLLMGRWRTSSRRVRKSRATISRADYPCHRPPSARTQGSTGRSSIRSRSEHRNRCYEPRHGAPAHLARPAVGRTGRCSTEAR
jgi:hypothetical protein